MSASFRNLTGAIRSASVPARDAGTSQVRVLPFGGGRHVCIGEGFVRIGSRTRAVAARAAVRADSHPGTAGRSLPRRHPGAAGRRAPAPACQVKSGALSARGGHLVALVAGQPVLVEPGFRDSLLRAGQPRLDDRIFQLVSIEVGEVRDAEEHGWITVEMRCCEEEPAVVREHQLLHSEIGDAEHEHIVEPLARVRVDCILTEAAVEAKDLAVQEIRRSAVVRDFLRRLREREGKLVEVGHGRHRASFTLGVVNQ